MTAFTRISTEKLRLFCTVSPVFTYGGTPRVFSSFLLFLLNLKPAAHNATRLFAVLLTTCLLMVGVESVNATIYYSRASANWTVNSTWSTVSYFSGTNTGTYPQAGDIVNIGNNRTVTVNAAVVCTDITIDSGSTLTTSGANTVTLSGNWTNNGTFTQNTGTVTFNGASAQTIVGTSKTTFYNLIINNTTPATTVTNPTKAFAATGYLTITQGNLIIQATDANYTVTGDLTVSANGTLTHSVQWTGLAVQAFNVGGNISISGQYDYTAVGKALIKMTGTGKTITTGTSSLSLLGLSNATVTANGPVTLDDNFWAGWNSGSASFTTAGYNITAKGGVLNDGGTITINGGTFTVTGGGLNVGIVNQGGTVNFSSGTLNADKINVGDGTYTGTFNNSGGTVNITGDLTISTTGNYTCSNSPIINVGGNWTNKGTFNRATSTVTMNGAAQTIGGTITTTFYNLTISGSNTKTLARATSVAASLSVTDGATLDLSTFPLSTPTSVNMECGGLTGSSITGSGTGILTLGGNVSVTDDGTGTASATISCPVTLGATRTFTVADDGTSAADLTINGIISGGFGITKSGLGTMVLAGNNSYSGATLVNVGTLKAGVITTAFGSCSAVTLANTAGVTLDITGYNTSIGSLAGGGATGGNVTLGSATLTIGCNNSNTTFSGIISGAGAITKTGTGTLTLSGANSYTGATTINTGTLQAGVITNAFGSCSAVTLANTAGAILNLNSFSNSIGSLAGGGGAGGNVTLGSATLTIGCDNTSTTYSGVISGTGLITKIGSGTLTLSGNNTYTGNTTISAGILSLGGSNRIANTSNIILNGGTFNTGATVGYSETVATLGLTDNSTIALGTGSHTLTFSASNGVSWTSGKSIMITGWTGSWNGTTGTAGKIFAGNNASGLTVSQLSQIEFFNSGDNNTYTATILSTGEVVPGAAKFTPLITVTLPTASFIGVVGDNSASQSFSVVGRYLSTSITVSAPANYQVSTNNSTWNSSVTYSQSFGNANGTLYVRYTPSAIESSVAATITLSSTGATNKTISLTGTAYQTAIYVRKGGYLNKDGTSWANAAPTIQKAVETSNNLTTKLPVYVAAGDYYQDPSYTTGDYAVYTTITGLDWAGWRNTFVMRDGVSVYGSFPEFNTSNNNNAGLTDRRTLTSSNTTYTTTLHAGPSPGGTADYRVLGPTYAQAPLSGSGTGLTSTWDGFTMTGATMTATPADGDDECGGGVYTVPGITISNCIVEKNYTTGINNDGSGVEMDGGTLSNCIIRNNSAGIAGSPNSNAGGAVNIRHGASNIINCLIYGNFASYGGGGLSAHLYEATPNPCYIINNTIANNTADANSTGIEMFTPLASATCYFYNNAVWNNSVDVGGYEKITPANETNNAWPSGYATTLGTNSFILSATNSYFANPTTDVSADYRLQPTSSLINKGIYGTPLALFPTLDIRSLFRDLTPDLGCYEFAPHIYYVNNATGTDGTTFVYGRNWTNPFKTLQYALDQYDQYEPPTVWVAQGNTTYIPTKDEDGNVATVGAAFCLRQNLFMYGGFAGTPGTEATNYSDIATKLNTRDFKTYATVLSGNTGNSSTDRFTVVSFTSGLLDDNWDNSLIDGFTITGAVGGGSYYGATLPTGSTIQNCKLTNNTSGLHLSPGANAYNMLVADNGGNGVYLDGNNKLVNATVVNNNGCAIFSPYLTSSVTNSILWGNINGNISGRATMTYCAASSNYGASDYVWPSGATGNIELYHRSPNFKDATNTTIANRNYELLLISPCLGKGNPSSSVNPLLKDVNGSSRTYTSGATTIDMGAFQKWDGYTASAANISQYRSATAYTIANFASTIGTSSNQANVELELPSGTTFDMGGNHIYTNYLEIIDDNTTAPVIKTGTLTATKAMYLRKCTRFRSNGTTGASTFFSVPFATPAFTNTWPISKDIDGGVIENSVRILKYDEPTRAAYVSNNSSAWVPTTASLDIGRGYAFTFASKVPNSDLATTIIIPSNGSVSLGSISASNFSMSYTNASLWVNTGWNLIGNPLSQIANIVTNNSTYWPYGLGVLTYACGVYLYNAANDSYQVTPLVDINAAGLSPYGAYFIKTDNHSTKQVELSAVVSGTGPMRVKSAVTASTGNIATPSFFRIQTDNGTISASTYVIFADDAHAEMINLEDSPNMAAASNGNNIVMNTYATGSTVALGINALPFVGNTMEIPLQVSVPLAGNYTISLPDCNDSTLVLLVEPNGTTHDLTSDTYTLTIDSKTVQNYTLRFSRRNVITGLNNLTSDSGIAIYQENGSAVVTSTSPLLSVSLYDINGQIIKVLNNSGTQSTISLPASGVYIVKAITSEKIVTRKLVYK